ncbi:HlyD family efflux transporter periplasmic adaptor subunit [Gloeocapsopsis sp. IPPAS B-1203]|uniref:efflux RND transporter periplasmic adaptor subunit n=1 Tax=Gloeocapsopsis sp. IPPAS B-1203 TaxID=2049454 RepID=UPI000C182D83|nr:HlyD family efflux transporter periplasmic adaptor subunit [Gloeocapsopsis sp. IPPAS B-1203]PIG91514.1 efflux transporter periplasmic adaptor subunit [Gloeocapsopsis sp. IPPAS B-1203]
MISLPLSKRSSKLLIYLGIALATAIAIVLLLRPTPVAVEVGRVEQGKLQVTVNAEGMTRVRDRYILAAEVNGHLDRITLNEGDVVDVGDVVARIDSLPHTTAVQEALGRLAEWRAQRAGVETQRPKTAALAQARSRIATTQANQRQIEARVAQAQATLEQAQRDRQRAQYFASTGVISRQAREQAELNEQTKQEEHNAALQAAQAARSEVAVAQKALALLQAEQSDPDYLLEVYNARIASVEAELARLQDEAQRTEMRSPVRGQVLRVLQRSAQVVNDGTPLLELGDPTKLELVVDVLSSDAERVAVGNAMQVTSGTTQLEGRVRRVEPSAFTKTSALGVEEQRVNVIGSLDAPKVLGDGYRVDVQIVVWEKRNVLQAPLSALFRCNQAWCVFVVNNGKAERRPVTVGQRSDTTVEIQQGLTADELLILHPTEQIEDNRSVTIND